MTSDMGTYDENLCIRRIADDDSEAFGMLFRHYYPKTVILLNALTKDGTVSEDLEILIDGFIEEQCEAVLKKDSIRAVVEKMPARRKEIYILSRERGLSNAEIAKKLDISKKTVENHLNLALKEIRDVLAILIFFI